MYPLAPRLIVQLLSTIRYFELGNAKHLGCFDSNPASPSQTNPSQPTVYLFGMRKGPYWWIIESLFA